MKDQWRIDLLGQLRLRRGEAVDVPLQPQKTTALLAYLAYHHRHPHPREALVELFWPEEEPEAGRPRLRTLLYNLRELLARSATAADALLIAERGTVHMDAPAFTTDVAEFHAALRAAEQAVYPTERVRRLEEAATLYGGELLPGYYEPWVLTERQALAERHLAALRQLAAAREQVGDGAGALAAARQAVASDPLREEAHYEVMRLAAALGQPSTALRQYQELERILREELDESPSAAARALAEELRESARTLAVARRTPLGGGEGATGGGGEGARGRGGEGASTSTSATAASPVPSIPPSPRHPLAPSPTRPLPPPRLPVPLTRFFGREEETEQIVEWLATGVARLVTVTGPGGSGKTRLAIAAAGRLQELFGEAMTFLSLADLTEAAQFPDALAAALGLIRSAEIDPLEAVIARLGDDPWLLVLDNYEHLVEDGALLLHRLLERLPLLAALVTSRRRLGVSGEQEFALLPLPTPRVGGVGCGVWGVGSGKDGRALADSYSLHPTPDTLTAYPSVRLFVDRARAARGGFALNEANAAAVAALCDRLEGLPLAIELAAARMGVLTPAQILAQLEQRFTFLVSRQRDLPARHRSLRAAVETSYVLLPPALQQFFARLTVFRGGCTLEAAAAVCDFGFWILDFGLATESKADPPEDRTPLPDPIQNPKSKIQNTLGFLEQLREASLILVEEEPGGGLRYRLLETLREYGWEQLIASGELATARTRHRDWYLQVAEQFAAQARRGARGPEEASWLARLEAERENLWAALACCREEADAELARGEPGPGAEAGVRLAYALFRFWVHRGYLAEGLQWLEGALAQGEHLPAALRGRALLAAAHLAGGRGRPDQSRSFLRSARAAQEQALHAAGASGARAEAIEAMLLLAESSYELDDMEAAEQLAREAREQTEALADRAGLARALQTLAGVALRRGDRNAARPLLEERLAINREMGDAEAIIHGLGGLGHLARDEGDYARAHALYAESLRLRYQAGFELALAQSLEDIALLAARAGQVWRAIGLLGAEEAFCETLGAQPPVANRSEYGRVVPEARTALGEAEFAAAWAEGRAMSLEQAVEYALAAEPVGTS